MRVTRFSFTPRGRLRRRLGRWLLRLALGLAGLALLLGGLLWFLVGTTAGSRWVVSRVVQAIDEGIPGSIEFDYVGGTLLDTVRVANVVIRDPAGYEVLRVAEAEAAIDLPLLLEGVARFEQLQARGVDVTVRKRRSYLGLQRAFVEPLEPGERPPERRGTWLFDLPAIRLADLRVRVDLEPVRLDVRFANLDATVLAGRGSYRAETRGAGAVELERIGDVARGDRVEFSGELSSRTGRFVEAGLELRQDRDRLTARLAAGPEGFQGELRAGPDGVGLDRYLAELAPDLALGTARTLTATVEGPTDALDFRLAAATDAGTVELDGRLRGSAGARQLAGRVQVDGARPVRLGLPDAPAALTVTVGAAVRADLTARTADVLFAGLRFAGVEVPGGPHSGTLHADARELRLELFAADGSNGLEARLEQPTALRERAAFISARLAPGAEVALPWLTAAGPVELTAAAGWSGARLDTVHVEWTGEGTLASARPALTAAGPWRAALDAQRTDADGWVADGLLLGTAGAVLQAGTVALAGPLCDAASPPGAPAGVPVHAELDPDGNLRVAVLGASLASVRDEGRGFHNTTPLVADLALTRAPGGAVSLAGALQSEGALVAGPRDVVTGPVRLAVEAAAASGEWRLVRGEASAAGVRHGAVRTGAVQAELDPAADGRASRLRASATGVRNGPTRIGTVTVDLTGTTRAGSGVVRLDSPRVDVSSTVRLRRTDDGAVEAGLEGGLLQSRGTALRFHGSLRAGVDGLDVPGLMLEGQGASGRVAGTLRDWRRLRFTGRVAELPVAALFDLAELPPDVAELVHEGRLTVDVTAQGRVDAPEVRFTAALDDFAVGPLEHSVAEIRGIYERGAFQASGRARLANGGSLAADLSVPAGGGAVLYVQAADVPLEVAGLWLPADTDLRGTLADGSLLYHAGERTLELQARVRDLAVGRMAPLDGWADLRCVDTRCRDRFRFGGRDGAVAEGDGRVDLARTFGQAADLRHELLEAGRWLQRFAFADLDLRSLGLAGPDLPAGRFSGTVVLSGSPLRPEGRARFDGRDVAWAARPDLPPLGLQLQVDLEPDAVRAGVRATDAAGTDLRGVAEWPVGLRELLAGGDVPWRPDLRLAGGVAGDVLRLAAPERFTHAPAERVGLRARWQPAESTEPSRWTATVVAELPFVGAVPVQAAVLALDGAGTRADLLGAIRNQEAAALHLRGTAELPPDPDLPGGADAFPDLRAFGRFEPAAVRLEAVAVARALDIASLPMPSVVADATGRVDLDLTVRGPVTDPEIAGSFHLKDAGFVLVPTAQRFERVELLGGIADGRLTLERASAASGGGRTTLDGTLDVADLDAVAFDLHVDSTDFPLAGEGTTFGRVTCELGLTGTLTGDAAEDGTGGPRARRLDADLAVTSCLLLLPRQRSQAVMELGDHPDFVVGGRAATAPASAAGTPVPLDVVVRVDVPGELLVRREDMQVAGVGRLEFRSEPSRGQASAVSGNVEVRRGWADMFGRRFDVEFGDVAFTGRHPVDGAIDVRLAAQTAEGPVYIDVTGTLRHPQIQLTSDPPRDQSEILALLFLGRTEVADEERLAVAQQADRVAQGVAEAVGLAFFQSEVARRITPLSVLRLDPGREGLADARIRAGMNLLNNLYVEYSFQPAADELQNSNEGRIEWLILRNLSLESYYGDAQSGGIHLQYRTEW
jgi:autotransporter translocation and assembly factor TamB